MKHIIAGSVVVLSLLIIIIVIILHPWQKDKVNDVKKGIISHVTPTITPTPTPALIPCNGFQAVSDKVRELMPEYTPQPITETTVRITGVVWKKEEASPFIRYTASAGIILRGTPDNIIKFSDTLPELRTYITQNGYKENSLNTYADRTGYLSLSTLANYAFTKDNELFTITYNSLGGGSVTMMCARQDQLKDQVYTDLIAMKPLPAEWTSIDNSTVVDIWEIHDSVVYLQVETLGAGSYGQYWYKDNYGWTKLYEGQALPACGLFEEKKAGHGIECSDCTDQNAGCIIRKTH